jgi:hypothetical protein
MKRSDSLYIGLIFVVFAVAVGAWAALSPFVSTAGSDTAPTLQAAQYRYTADGERYTVSPSRFTRICPATGCIPALAPEQIAYTTAGAADTWLNASDTIISISVDGQTVAYPVTIMQRHMIANTRIEGTPIVVTYAPHAGYGAAFSRELETAAGPRTASFLFTGKLLHGDIVMRDSITGTRWGPYHGDGIAGEHTGRKLQRIDTDIVRWGLWKQQHPDGRVLSPQTGVYQTAAYVDDPYFAYRENTDVPGKKPELSGLHPKDIVYGIDADGRTAAFRAVHVRDLPLVEDTLGDQPVLLVQDKNSGAVHAFSRTVDGETVSFTRTDDGRLQSEDGTVWTAQGRAIDGPLAGQQLDTVRLSRMYWFAWKLFNPSTRLYTPSE